MKGSFSLTSLLIAALLLASLSITRTASAQSDLTAQEPSLRLATTVPALVFPTGTLPISRIVYIWAAVAGATQYQYQVYQASTLVLDKTLGDQVCTAGTCKTMPAVDLNSGNYTWRVRAMVGGIYQAFTSWQAFTVSVDPASGFYSPFTNDSAGWVAHKGTWTLESTNYFTTLGVAGKAATVSHNNDYSTLSFEVRMKRAGCAGCVNVLAIRGTPTLDTVGWWNKEYTFDYTNSGLFSVWKDSNGTYTALKSWTSTSAIVQGGWNLLKVTADGATLKFFINNVLVWSGSDASYPSGQVGIGMYRNSTSTGNKLWVDWARLDTTITSAAQLEGLEIAPDLLPDTTDQVEVPGGTHNMAP